MSVSPVTTHVLPPRCASAPQPCRSLQLGRVTNLAAQSLAVTAGQPDVHDAVQEVEGAAFVRGGELFFGHAGLAVKTWLRGMGAGRVRWLAVVVAVLQRHANPNHQGYIPHGNIHN